MSDLRDRFAALDLLDAPDQWNTIEERATAAQPLSTAPVNEVSRWRGPAWAAAVAVVVLLLGTPLWLLKSGSEPESEPVVVPPSIEASEVLVPDSWDSILARTEARPAPAAATCPTFSIPEAADRAGSPFVPYEGGWLAAAFDQHAGLVIYRDSERTWAFDVCANTWTRLQDHDEEALLWSGALVYDIDSDTTVSFGWEKVAVFDPDTGSWTERDYPTDDAGHPLASASETDWNSISGVVYDPVSGLIVASTAQDRILRAYDVDSDTWTEIGSVPTPSEQDSSVNLLGYLPALDRLIVTPNVSGTTFLVDPRTGATDVISTPSPGYPLYTGFRGTFWQTASSAIVDYRSFSLCEFSAQSLAWDYCYSDDNNFPPSLAATSSESWGRVIDAIVEDTVNDRLLFLTLRGYAEPDTWAHDQITKEWTPIPFAISDLP
jgi:hypothetical protein